MPSIQNSGSASPPLTQGLPPGTTLDPAPRHRSGPCPQACPPLTQGLKAASPRAHLPACCGSDACGKPLRSLCPRCLYFHDLGFPWGQQRHLNTLRTHAGAQRLPCP